jgi:hypothetical protein
VEPSPAGEQVEVHPFRDLRLAVARRVVDDMRAFHAAEPNAFKRDEIAGPPASRAEEALTIG